MPRFRVFPYNGDPFLIDVPEGADAAAIQTAANQAAGRYCGLERAVLEEEESSDGPAAPPVRVVCSHCGASLAAAASRGKRAKRKRRG